MFFTNKQYQPKIKCNNYLQNWQIVINKQHKLLDIFESNLAKALKKAKPFGHKISLIEIHPKQITT